MAKIKRELITIKIDADWGSPFQRAAALNGLQAAIQGWQAFYRMSHQDNKITHRVSARDLGPDEEPTLEARGSQPL